MCISWKNKGLNTINMHGATTKKHICAVTVENHETSQREFWRLLRYQFRDNFFVLFISVVLGISFQRTTTRSTNYTQSMNIAHVASQPPLLLKKKHCLEIVMKSLNRSCDSLYCFRMCCPVL